MSCLLVPSITPTLGPDRASSAQVPCQVEDAQTARPTERWALGIAQGQHVMVWGP